MQFIGVKKYIPSKQNITMVYQRPTESLKEWLARFREVVTATMDMTDREALMGALSSMKKNSPSNMTLTTSHLPRTKNSWQGKMDS